jgi:hypothetical protein
MVVAAAVSAAAQQQPGIFGLYNPATGQFQPAPPAQVNTSTAGAQGTGISEPTATAFRSGTIKFVINITVRNGTPGTNKPNCYVSVAHAAPNFYYSNSASVVGTRTSNSARCEVRIPYYWPKADTAQPVGMGVSVYVGNWSAQVPLPSIPLPAQNATTTITAATHL